MKRTYWIPVLTAMVMACMNEPDPESVCGVSVGCGNPIKLSLDLSPTNDCEGPSCGAQFFNIPFSIRIDDSLIVELKFQTKVDSMKGMAYVYAGDQIPMVDPHALDSFPMAGKIWRLSTADFRRAHAASAWRDSAAFPFNLLLKASFGYQTFIYEEGSLVLGLQVHPDVDTFLISDQSPFKGDSNYLRLMLGNFKGLVDMATGFNPDGDSTNAGYAYIPGSPYWCRVHAGTGRFVLDSLPRYGTFELRGFTVPHAAPADWTVPVFLLKSDVASSSRDRAFKAGTASPPRVRLPPAFFQSPP